MVKALSRETVHILVGAAVLLAAPLLFLLFFNEDARTGSASGYELTAHYNSIDGLGIGADVLLAGVPVGKVTGESFDPEAMQAVVTMTVRSDIRIPDDTVAMVVGGGLLGGKFVKLAVGGSEDMLAPGDSFEYTQDSVIVEALLEKVVLWAEARRKTAREKAIREKQEHEEAPAMGAPAK